MFGLTKPELRILSRLTTPTKIQNFLDTLPMNFEEDGDTYYSPRLVLRHKKAHCLEGALLAATALWLRGERPLLLDLTAKSHDDDHVVALYKTGGYWGAISKTNHAVLRFRDPIYRTTRELALSYFHEYFLTSNGEKTLVSYGRPLDLRRLKAEWVTSEVKLDHIAEALDRIPHYPLVPLCNKKNIRPATAFERLALEKVEWLAEKLTA